MSNRLLPYEQPPEPDERPTAALVGLIMASFALLAVVASFVLIDGLGFQPPPDVRQTAALLSVTTLLVWLLGTSVAGIELWESRHTPSVRRRLAVAGLVVGIITPVAVFVMTRLEQLR